MPSIKETILIVKVKVAGFFGVDPNRPQYITISNSLDNPDLAVKEVRNYETPTARVRHRATLH